MALAAAPSPARRPAGGFADGVIVGSAFVQRLLDAPDLTSGVQGVRELAGDLAAGVRRPARAAKAP